MIERRLKTRSAEGTLTLGQTVLELMLPAPRMVLLRGDLGAGKTTLVKGIARAAGAQEIVTSPTFTLVHEYQGRSLRIYHLDLYRIETEAQLMALGLEEMEAQPDALTLVEWGDRFASLSARARGQIVLLHGAQSEEREIAVQML